jgi:ABC-2 type transport system ATP-binding protein
MVHAGNREEIVQVGHTRLTPFAVTRYAVHDGQAIRPIAQCSWKIPVIEVKSLTRLYGDVVAVDHISFKAASGEILGLLGPNGAGKTTTMRMLTGFLPPTSGTALIDKFDIVESSMEARGRVGYLPERVPLYQDMTVFGYILFWAQLRRVKAPRDRTVAVLKQFDLLGRRDRLVRQLSKGLRQRLGLAQALVHDPPVIILDEPTIGIDPQQVIEVRQAVRDLRKTHTVLFSTHILSEAEEICDRVVIIDHGKIVAQGTPEALQKQVRANTFVVDIGRMDHERASAVLRSITGVVTVRRKGSTYTVETDGARDIRGDISAAVVAAGGELLEMTQVRSTLEDVFLRAVQSGADGKSGGRAS